MKLSEILPDWIKKREFIPTNCSKASKDMEKEGQFNGYPRGMKNEVMAHYQNGYFKGALDVLSSCDREIDREALAKVMYEVSVNYDGFKPVLFVLEDLVPWEEQLTSIKESYLLKADLTISTMPTWLKPTERK